MRQRASQFYRLIAQIGELTRTTLNHHTTTHSSHNGWDRLAVTTASSHRSLSGLGLSLSLSKRYFGCRSNAQANVKSQAFDQQELKTRQESIMMQTHNEAVTNIASTVRAFHERKQKFRINHGSTNSTRPRNHQNVVDVGHLNNILQVDTERRTVLVEPNVSMDRLVEGTLQYGLVPPVVMEFPGITVGGGYSGTSGESSSFKHGFFDRTINYVEMVLADGTPIRCSRTEKPDLFNGAAGAMGTLGVTTLIELQLVEAKKYIETTYYPINSVSEALTKLDSVTGDAEVDYVDGILFSPSSGAIITGKMTNTPPANTPIRSFSGSRDPWFYLHVQDQITKSSSAPTVEAIPLAEYLFRYDRGGFWVGASAFKYFRTPFNKLTRWFLDDFLHTRMMYTALHASGKSRQYIVQDLAVPYENVEAFIDYTTNTFGIWPLWLCPLKTPKAPTMHPHLFKSKSQAQHQQTTTIPLSIATPTNPTSSTSEPESDKMLNIGLWGFGPTDYETFVHLNRSLESKLHALGAVRWNYAHNYESEGQFWQTYDKSWYIALREKYGATGLPDVYEKVKIDVDKERATIKSWWNRYFFNRTWIGGTWGVWAAIRSKSYIAARKSTWKWKGSEKVVAPVLGSDGEAVGNGDKTRD